MTDVLHVLAPAPVGGLESVVENLAAGLAARGRSVSVAAILEPENAEVGFVRRLSGRGVDVRTLVVPHRSYLAEARELRDLLDDCDPGVVHTHGYRSDVIAGHVARRSGYPVVSTVHGFIPGDLKGRFFQWLQRRSLRRFDGVVAVSEPLGRKLRASGVAEGKLHVVRNAWNPRADVRDRADARAALGLPAEGFVVGWVGRLSREKGADVLLESLPEVDIPQLTASLIGDGPLRSDLERRVRTLGLEDTVRFHGLVPDAASVYRAFDAFVLSSRTEGTPISLFEAMHAGVPVVAARVGGVPDVVRDDVEARLVPPEDPAALAAALRSLHEEPEAAEERASRARRRLVREFGPDRWLDRYEEIYARAAGDPVCGAAEGRRTASTERPGAGVSR